jgi:hypothetical protein
MGRLSPLGILTPVQWQIQFPVDERMSASGDIAEVDPNLTVCEPFRLCRNIVGQHRALSAQVRQDVRTQVIAQAISIPDGLRKQALHPVRMGFSGMFCQLPPVFPCGIAQDPLQVLASARR